MKEYLGVVCASLLFLDAVRIRIRETTVTIDLSKEKKSVEKSHGQGRERIEEGRERSQREEDAGNQIEKEAKEVKDKVTGDK